MERLWLNEARHKYPMKWIVAVNCSYDEKQKLFGDIYSVFDNWESAHELTVNLRNSNNMGDVTCTEGHDPRPQIGGFTVCPL